MSLSSSHEHEFDAIVYIDPFWDTTDKHHFLALCSECGAMVWCNYIKVFRSKRIPTNTPSVDDNLRNSMNKHWFSDIDYPHLSKKSLDEWKDAAYNVLVEEMRV